MAQKQKIYLPTFISSINYDAARVLPHIYFYNGTKACEPYYIENENGTAHQFDVFPYFDNYSGNTPTTSSLSLLFNNEAAVYGEAPSASLYTEYWEKYVELLYNPRTRIMNCSAIIPLADYFKMNLNDIVQFRGNHYHLRAINNYNLSNGECDLELLGPILGDVLSYILPGIQCEFDFDISDINYGYRIQSCGETPVTYEVSFNSTASFTAGMVISASSEISGCWYISGSVTQSALDFYNVGVYNEFSSCLDCTFFDSTYYVVEPCAGGTSHTIQFAPNTSSIAIGNAFTSSFASLQGCYTITGTTSSAEYTNVHLNALFTNCASCSYTPPPTSSAYLVYDCSTPSSTYYVTFYNDIVPSSTFTSTTGSLAGGCWNVSGSAYVTPDFANVGDAVTYVDCTDCLNPTVDCVEFRINNVNTFGISWSGLNCISEPIGGTISAGATTYTGCMISSSLNIYDGPAFVSVQAIC